MGDRITFVFAHSLNQSADDSVLRPLAVTCLYSHWGGASSRVDLAEGIAHAQNRWSDTSYATRIAVSHIIGDQWGSETGFGLYASTAQEEHEALKQSWQDRDPLWVDWTAESVHDFETGEVLPFSVFIARHLESRLREVVLTNHQSEVGAQS